MHPVEQPGVCADPLGGVVDVRCGGFVQARDRDVAVIVVQAGEHPHQDAERVRHHSSPHPRMKTVVEGGDLDHTVRQAAQRHGQGRHVGAPVVRIRDDDDVGGQQVMVS